MKKIIIFSVLTLILLLIEKPTKYYQLYFPLNSPPTWRGVCEADGVVEVCRLTMFSRWSNTTFFACNPRTTTDDMKLIDPPFDAVLIIDPPFSVAEDNDNLAFNTMKDIFAQLGMKFKYQYVTHQEAMQMIDAEADAIFFPYQKPRLMSTRILCSDTLYTITHKIYYDTRRYDDLTVNSLTDLKGYIVGSHGKYQHEPQLRRAGLTVHYSHNNADSFQKLIEGKVDFVVEETIQAQLHLKTLSDDNKQFISAKDIDLFPTPLFAITAAQNEKTAEFISEINNLMSFK